MNNTSNLKCPQCSKTNGSSKLVKMAFSVDEDVLFCPVCFVRNSSQSPANFIVVPFCEKPKIPFEGQCLLEELKTYLEFAYYQDSSILSFLAFGAAFYSTFQSEILENGISFLVEGLADADHSNIVDPLHLFMKLPELLGMPKHRVCYTFECDFCDFEFGSIDEEKVVSLIGLQAGRLPSKINSVASQCPRCGRFGNEKCVKIVASDTFVPIAVDCLVMQENPGIFDDYNSLYAALEFGNEFNLDSLCLTLALDDKSGQEGRRFVRIRSDTRQIENVGELINFGQCLINLKT